MPQKRVGNVLIRNNYKQALPLLLRKMDWDFSAEYDAGNFGFRRLNSQQARLILFGCRTAGFHTHANMRCWRGCRSSEYVCLKMCTWKCVKNILRCDLYAKVWQRFRFWSKKFSERSKTAPERSFSRPEQKKWCKYPCLAFAWTCY